MYGTENYLERVQKTVSRAQQVHIWLFEGSAANFQGDKYGPSHSGSWVDTAALFAAFFVLLRCLRKCSATHTVFRAVEVGFENLGFRFLKPKNLKMSEFLGF